jgi:TonB family protein
VSQQVAISFDEYRGSLFRQTDWSFVALQVIIVLIFSAAIIALGFIPVPEVSEDDIKALQDRYATMVLKMAPKKEEKAKDEGSGEKKSEAEAKKDAMEDKAEARVKEQSSKSAAERSADRQASAANRDAARAKAAAQVANVGALAMLTAVGDGSDDDGGEQVEDLIGQGGVQSANLGKALSTLDGLKAGGSGTGMGAGRGRRGGSGAAGAGGNVDDLLSGIGTASSRSLARKGEIALSKPDAVQGQAAKAANRDIEAINGVIRQKMGAIQFCFKKELRRDPNLSGKITVKFTVEANGRVSNASVKDSNLKSPSLEQCLLKTVSMLMFKPIAESEGSMTVTYPFVFSGG